MAIKRGKANAAPFPIKYERGNLVNPTPEQAEREEASRERHGVEQIDRRMRGEEIPADPDLDRAELKALGFIPERPANAVNFDPGAVVGRPEVDARARDRVTGRAKYSSRYLPAGHALHQGASVPSSPRKGREHRHLEGQGAQGRLCRYHP